MHTKSDGTTLAYSILHTLVAADEMLKTADAEDRMELRERLAQTDPREFTHLWQFGLAASIVMTPAEEEEPSASNITPAAISEKEQVQS